jgi:hypothetical protein
LQAAINSAYDPNNIRKMNEVPGMKPGRPRIDYDIATYLATCWQDFSEEHGTGFDDVRQRGEWAQHYDVSKLGETTQVTELLANSFFASDDISAAYDAVQAAHWNTQNQVAWAHMLYQDKAPFQADSFLQWAKHPNGDPRVNDLLKQVNVGFTSQPTQHSIHLGPTLTPKMLLPVPTNTQHPQSFEACDEIVQKLQAMTRANLQEQIALAVLYYKQYKIDFNQCSPWSLAYLNVLLGLASGATANQQWNSAVELPGYSGTAMNYYLFCLAFYFGALGDVGNLTGSDATQYEQYQNYNYPNPPFQ